MSEVLRELVVALSLDSDHFARNLECSSELLADIRRVSSYQFRLVSIGF
ncbi:MAG: hypothetical protein RSE58_05970 [Clostridia bacterium]